MLAFLALASAPVLRWRVLGALWPSVDAHRAAGNLRSTIWRLPTDVRSLVGANGDRMRLVDVDCDVDEMRERARLLTSEAPVDDLGVERFLVDILPTWYDNWVVDERERCRAVRLAALEALCRRLTAAGRAGEAIEAALAAVVADPLRESAHRALIEAHLAEGNRHEAVRQFERYRALLAVELGHEPPADSQRLLPTWS